MAEKAGARWVVIVALAGNIGVATLKFGAFLLTGSSALLTEGVHSLVDTLDQIFLLIGQARAARPANEDHPFGYGMELYFWGFVVALMVFFAGGAVGIWEGVDKLLRPMPMTKPGISLTVIALSAVFEVVSFRTAYREYRRIVRGRRVRLLRFVILSKDPSLFGTIVEDVVSMAGLIIAAAGVICAGYLNIPWMDAVASFAIGLLLIAAAVLMANETRSLIAGEAAAPPLIERLKAAVEGSGADGALQELRTLQLGADAILAAVTWRFKDGADVSQMDAAVDALDRALRDTDPRIKEVLFAPARLGRRKRQVDAIRG